MKWYWWTLIGLVILGVIIYFVYKNKTTGLSIKGNALHLEGSTCAYIGLPVSGIALPSGTIPSPQQGIITNGVCGKDPNFNPA